MFTAQSLGCPVGHGAPVDSGVERGIPLYTECFAADPHRAYREMRDRYGALVPVELSPGVPATLVIGYREALRILHDPEHFPADPRVWERGVPAGCPVLPMMQWRPNALRTAGVQHARYREANVDALGRVDLHRTHAVVEQIALTHINRLCEVGEADLVGEFAFPVVFDTICALMGCEADVSVQAVEGMAMMFDTVNAARGNELLLAALAELVHRKRACPGEDITSWLISHHTGLDDEELVQQLVTIFGATSEPQTNLIINTLLVMMTGDRFGGSVTGGSLSTRDALDEVLFTDPPMANFAITYPRQPILIGTVWLPPINRW